MPSTAAHGARPVKGPLSARQDLSTILWQKNLRTEPSNDLIATTETPKESATLEEEFRGEQAIQEEKEANASSV
jgi:hypothetical protein